VYTARECGISVNFELWMERKRGRFAIKCQGHLLETFFNWSMVFVLFNEVVSSGG
jgi:hypothetical protein